MWNDLESFKKKKSDHVDQLLLMNEKQCILMPKTLPWELVQIKCIRLSITKCSVCHMSFREKKRDLLLSLGEGGMGETTKRFSTLKEWVFLLFCHKMWDTLKSSPSLCGKWINYFTVDFKWFNLMNGSRELAIRGDRAYIWGDRGSARWDNCSEIALYRSNGIWCTHSSAQSSPQPLWSYLNLTKCKLHLLEYMSHILWLDVIGGWRLRYKTESM